jgi:sugar/nucleoside kinase (ribokinase family)
MTGARCDVLCAGILVADLFMPPLPRLPREGELLKVDAMLLDTGGCAANTATDLARLGVRAGVAGRVGADSFGDFIRADLGRKGLADVSGIRVSAAHPTSQTVILPVTGEDRRYIHCPGANADFTLDDIDMDAVCAARILYVGGYLLLPGLSAPGLAGLLQEARRHGVRTVLDVAGVDPDHGMEHLVPVLPHTDAFLPNEDEAALLTHEEEPRRQSAIFADAGAGTVIITRGARGILARTRETLLNADAFHVDAVDGSGSGDAFDAGYIVGMLEGWDIERAVAFASAVGASCCTRLGCTAGVFDRGQAERFVAEHPLAFERETGEEGA